MKDLLQKAKKWFEIKDKCSHLISNIKVISTCVTCEITVEVCETCKKQLTEPKTDC